MTKPAAEIQTKFVAAAIGNRRSGVGAFEKVRIAVFRFNPTTMRCGLMHRNGRRSRRCCATDVTHSGSTASLRESIDGPLTLDRRKNWP
jgi:hypothetical protein